MKMLITFGINTTGGMDDEDFGIYITNTLIPLFQDSEYASRKRSIFKVNSCPDHINVKLLVSLWLLGFYLYLGAQTPQQQTFE